MSVTIGTLLFVSLKSFLRDPGYVLFSLLLPAVLSFATDLFSTTIMPWPLLLFLGLCDAHAFSSWLGGTKRSYSMASSTRISSALSLTIVSLLMWTTRVLVIAVSRSLAVGFDLLLMTLAVHSAVLNIAAGTLVSSFLLLINGIWGGRTPWLLVSLSLLVSLLFGASIWVSGLWSDPAWQRAMSSVSDSLAAYAVSLLLLSASLLSNSTYAWAVHMNSINSSLRVE